MHALLMHSLLMLHAVHALHLIGLPLGLSKIVSGLERRLLLHLPLLLPFLCVMRECFAF
jgi:hypothetical protein